MYETKIVKLEQNFNEIAEAMKEAPVAFPTETVYGLGAIAWREDLVRKVFEVKNRPGDNPLIVHVSSLKMLKTCIDGEIPEIYAPLIEAFWPGPLTLLFRKHEKIPHAVTGGGKYVAVRIPNHKTTLRLIEELNAPVVGPSANRSGRPSPTSAEHVFTDLNGKIPYIIDGGVCAEGIESTVVNGLLSPPLLLRPGVITFEELQTHLPNIAFPEHGSAHTLASPGTRYKHYAPEVEVVMFTGTEEEKIEKIKAEIRKSSYRAVGILAPEKVLRRLGSEVAGTKLVHFSLGGTLREIAHNLFDGLRYLDREAEVIYTVEVEDMKEGRAVMDRLNRASSRRK